MTHTQIQRIIDSFSIGKLYDFKPMDQDITFDVFFKDVLTGKNITMPTQLHFFKIHTSHGHFWLMSQKPHPRINTKELHDALNRHLNLHFFSFYETGWNRLVTHHFDMHWYLLNPYQTLTPPQALTRLQDLLINQEIWIEVGYGGTLFIEIGPKIKPEILRFGDRFYRQLHLYTDEWWEIWKDGQKITDRFTDGCEEVVKNTLSQPITAVSVQPSFQKTFISMGEYTLVIYRQDENSTWQVDDRINSVSLTLKGKKTFELADYHFQRPSDDEPKPKPFVKQKDEYIRFRKVNTPLKPTNAYLFLQSLEHASVKEISNGQGYSFSLELEGKNRRIISIHAHWQLFKKNKRLIDSRSALFRFYPTLKKQLESKKILSITCDAHLTLTEVTFENDLVLRIPTHERHIIWTAINHAQGYYLAATSDGQFEYDLYFPDELAEKYLAKEKGRTFADLMYSLDFYRDLLAGK